MMNLTEAKFTNLLKFGEFDNKLKNRMSEFDAIRPHLPKKSHYTTLSFPANYDFETSFYNVFHVPLTVYVMQTNFNTAAAKNFIKNTNNMCSVLVPVKLKKGKYYPRKSIRSDDITGNSAPIFAPITSNKYSVHQGFENLPPKFDLIDLDFMGTYSPRFAGQIGTMYNEKLENRGLFFVTVNLSGYRELKTTKTKSAKELNIDLNDPILNKFDRKNLITPKYKDFFKDVESLKNFGINTSNSEKLNQLKSLASNIIIDIKSICGNKSPIYINLYRGGVSVNGRIMLRLIFKK